MGITKEQFSSILLPNLRVREGFALTKSDTSLVLTVPDKTTVSPDPEAEAISFLQHAL